MSYVQPAVSPFVQAPAPPFVRPVAPSYAQPVGPLHDGRGREEFPVARPVPGDYVWWRHRLVTPGLTYAMDRTWSVAGWAQVADDLWRVVHSDRSGARRADSAVVGLGLGAALLIELLLGGQVVLEGDGRVRLTRAVETALTYRTRAAAVAGQGVMTGASMVPDRIADELLMVVFAEPEPLPVEMWVAYLASRASQRVGQRLLNAGHVTAERALGFLGRTVYRPVDADVAAWPAVRLLMPLRGAELDLLDQVLLGLCWAMGLDRWLFDAQPPGEVERLRRGPDCLPAPFPDLWLRLDTVLATSASRLR